MKKYLTPILGLILLVGLPLTSSASIISWGGICEDCPLGGPPSPAFAELYVGELNNVPGGTDLMGNGEEYYSLNLLDFVFYSSNFEFGLYATEILYADGVIPSAPNSAANVSIEFLAEIGYAEGGFGCEVCESVWTFDTYSDGSWQLFGFFDGFEQVADFGNNASFNTVPEPISMTLMGLGLLGLGWRRRQVSA